MNVFGTSDGKVLDKHLILSHLMCRKRPYLNANMNITFCHVQHSAAGLYPVWNNIFSKRKKTSCKREHDHQIKVGHNFCVFFYFLL